MPPLSAYTPFESLLFFQSLAALDARPTSFAAISDALRNNAFVRQNATFDAERLTPEALEELYATLMREGLEDWRRITSPGPDQNGHRPDGSLGSNPKKRKITNPTAEGLIDGASHATVVPSLVSHLYARYKERVTKEIRNEEKRYKEIRDEIERLQKEEYTQPEAPAVQEALSRPLHGPEGPVETKPEPSHPKAMDLDVKEERPVQRAVTNINKPAEAPVEEISGKQTTVVEQGAKAGVPPPPPATAGAQQGKPGSPQLQPQAVPQLATALPSQASQINGKVPVLSPLQQPSHNYRVPSPDRRPANMAIPPQSQPTTQPPSGPAAAVRPDHQHATPRPAVVISTPRGANAAPAPPTHPGLQTGEAVARRGSSISGPAILPQYPPAQQQFQQWSPHPTPQTPYAHISPYANSPYPNQTIHGRPLPSPNGPPVTQPDAGRGYHGPYQPQGPMTPGPVSVSQSPHPSFRGQETPGVLRQTPSFSASLSKRPPRPSIDTSGSLTPWKRSPRLSISRSPGSPVRPRPEDVSPISERAPSPTEALEAAHRSPGLNSRTEKHTGSGRTRRDRSTTSTRSRGRSITSRDEDSMTDSGSVTHRKIKHEMPSTPAGISEDAEAENRISSRRKGGAVAAQAEEGLAKGRPKRKRGASESIEIDINAPEPIRHDTTQYVLCTRNFPRTGAPIMNDVTAHKHASIFAKPLTERDAPGYKDLIYRPQDLKSIKSAIHQGSKAVTAATEAASTPAADGESPAPGAGTPSKNTVLMLQKTADLIPPKGIVNSAQLEKELIRMFANAIMFNPTPERSFGPAFPMITDSKSRESTHFSEVDEGGIIHDTREMCDDVEKAVTRWRAAERTADELGNKSILALRRGSASDVNMDSADETKG